MSFIYAIIFFALLGGAYAALYYWNHRTPVPEGCEDIKLECDGCKITSCDHHPNHSGKENEDV